MLFILIYTREEVLLSYRYPIMIISAYTEHVLYNIIILNLFNKVYTSSGVGCSATRMKGKA